MRNIQAQRGLDRCYFGCDFVFRATLDVNRLPVLQDTRPRPAPRSGTPHASANTAQPTTLATSSAISASKPKADERAIQSAATTIRSGHPAAVTPVDCNPRPGAGGNTSSVSASSSKAISSASTKPASSARQSSAAPTQPAAAVSATSVRVSSGSASVQPQALVSGANGTTSSNGAAVRSQTAPALYQQQHRASSVQTLSSGANNARGTVTSTMASSSSSSSSAVSVSANGGAQLSASLTSAHGQQASPIRLSPPPVASGQFGSDQARRAATDCLTPNCAGGCGFRHAITPAARANTAYCRDWCVRRPGNTGQYCPRGAVCPFQHPHRTIVKLTDCPACLLAAAARDDPSNQQYQYILRSFRDPGTSDAAWTQSVAYAAQPAHKRCLYTAGMESSLRHSTPVFAHQSLIIRKAASNVSSLYCDVWRGNGVCVKGEDCQQIHLMLR